MVEVTTVSPVNEQGRPFCTAEVMEIRDLTYDVKEICLKLLDPADLHFTAGQYITIEVTEYKNGQPRRNNRPYSVVSAPEEEGIIRLCVNRVGEGPGSTYLHSLKPNDSLQFFPPIGYFTVKASDTTPLLFVATGTGIAPIKAMISHLLHTGRLNPIRLYWGLRSEEDLYYQEEFSEWARLYPLFKLMMTLSKPSPAWSGMRGRVTDHLPHMVIDDVNNLDIYLCGNGEMIKEVRAMLLSRGVAKGRIHFEKFY